MKKSVLPAVLNIANVDHTVLDLVAIDVSGQKSRKRYSVRKRENISTIPTRVKSRDGNYMQKKRMNPYHQSNDKNQSLVSSSRMEISGKRCKL